MRTYRRKQQPLQVIDGVEELCRLCLNKSDNKEPIFNSQSNDVCSKLSTRITICIGLEVSRDENLPNTVCEACHKQLETCYTFRKNCEFTYQKLKQHLQAIENQRRCESAVKSEKTDLKSEKIDVITDEIEENTLIFNEVQENNTLHTDSFVYIINNSLKSGKNELYLVKNRDAQITTEANENRIINQLDLEIGELIVPDKANLEIVERGEDNCLSDGNEYHSVSKEDKSTVDEELQSVADENSSFSIDEENMQIEATPEEPSLDISSYIAKELLDNNIITAANDCLLLSPDMRIVLEMLTDDGAVVTLQLAEEGDKELHTPISQLMQQPAPGLVRVSLLKEAEAEKQRSPKDRLVCSVCSRQFSRRSALRRHARVHSGERAHECGQCGRRFAQRAVMLRHATTHQEKRPYPCSTCDKSFTQRGALKAHEASHCANTARQMTLHACPHCPKLFLYASGLSRHASVHSGRTFPCETCTRTFRDKSSLKRHARATRHTVREKD